MKHTKLFSLLTSVVLIAAVALISLAKPAFAQSTPYAVVCLVNNTAATINYQYKWGSQEWQLDTLEQDTNATHSWRYTSSKTSPKFTVRFDTDLTSDSEIETYALDRYQASAKSCYEGKVYDFEYASSWSIDLYDNE